MKKIRIQVFSIEFCSLETFNALRSLTRVDGSITSDLKEISEIAVNHFSSFLNSTSLPSLTSTLQWFNDLFPTTCSALGLSIFRSVPTREEFTKVIMKLNPNKSPRPDGFTSAIYKAGWDVLGSELPDGVLNFF